MSKKYATTIDADGLLVNTPSSTSTNEVIARFTISDASGSEELRIDNRSVSDGSFWPSINALGTTSTTAMYVMGTSTSDNSSDNAVIRLGGVKVPSIAAPYTSRTSFSARPIVQIMNGTAAITAVVGYDGQWTLSPTTASKEYLTTRGHLSGTEERFTVLNSSESSWVNSVAVSNTQSDIAGITLAKAAGTTLSSTPTAITTGESVARIDATGYFGATAGWNTNASIAFNVGTVTTDTHMPMSITFSTSNQLEGNLTSALVLQSTQQATLSQYGSGTYTGTPAYYLAIDSSGNIIEETGGAGDGNGIYDGSGTIGAAAVATITGTSTFTIDWSDTTDALLFTDSTKVLKFDGARLDIGGGTTAPSLRFWEPSGSGSNYVEFKAIATTSDQTYTLPVAYPSTSGRALISSTGGAMSWATLENWGDIWVVNTDGSVQVTADQNNDGITYYSPDNSIRMVGDNAYGGFSDDAITWRLAIDKLTNSLTSGTLATGDLFVVWDLDANENKYITANEMSSYFGGGGGGIYGGSGTIASAAVATLTSSSTFTIDYSGGTDAITITDTTSTIRLNGSAIYIGGEASTTEMRFLEASGNGSEYTGFKAPDSLGANQMYTLPSDTPNDGDVLEWNTGGTLSWETRVTGPGAVTDNTIALFNGTSGNAIDSSGVTLTTATDQFTLTNGNASLIVDDNSGGAGALRLSISATGIAQVDVAGSPDDIVSRTASQTITNKFINPRVYSTASASSVSIDGGYDHYQVTALATGLTIDDTIATTPAAGQRVVLRIQDSGSSQSLTWDPGFVPVGVTLPTATTSGKLHYFGMIWNNTDSVFDVVAYSVEA